MPRCSADRNPGDGSTKSGSAAVASQPRLCVSADGSVLTRELCQGKVDAIIDEDHWNDKGARSQLRDHQALFRC
jgi:hypothetical protein